jgi:hypothetical protein
VVDCAAILPWHATCVEKVRHLFAHVLSTDKEILHEDVHCGAAGGRDGAMAGCNTVEGAGKDVKATGAAVARGGQGEAQLMCRR